MKYLRFFSALLACLLMLSMGACAPREAVAAGDGVIDIIDVPEETAGQNAALPSPSATLTPIILGTPSGANPSVPMPTETPAFTANYAACANQCAGKDRGSCTNGGSCADAGAF